MTQYNSTKNQEIKRKFVEREILTCQSMLVEELLKSNMDGFEYDDIENLYINNEDEIEELQEKNENLQEQIDELSDEIDNDNTLDDSLIADREKQIQNLEQEIEEIDNKIEELKLEQEEPQEIYEWWLITSWFADKLRGYNEPIIDNDYGIWWGRGTSGQAILLDYVISKICEDMEILEGQNNEWDV